MVQVSVIIPTLNERRYIVNCLSSLSRQTFRDFEVIVADSYSTDGTEVAARKNGARVVLTAAKGPSAGRNAGARMAQGEILVFMDADTAASDNLLEEIVAAFASDDNIVFGSCHVAPLEHSPLLGRFAVELVNFTYGSVVRLGFPQIMGICCFFRTAVFRRLGGFSEEIFFGEDEELGWRAREMGKQVIIMRAGVATSLRRYRKFGYARLALYYVLNKLKFVLQRSPLRIRYFGYEMDTAQQ